MNEQRNIHRLSRKVMPKAEIDEYVRKCKEYSDYKVILVFY